jgi:hypothetical protein
LVLGALVLPIPTAIRVVMVVAAFLVLPLMLARGLEPAKKHRPSGS